MKAIYNGQLFTLGDNLNQADLLNAAGALCLRVPYNAPGLIIDPTDDELVECLDVDVVDVSELFDPQDDEADVNDYRG